MAASLLLWHYTLFASWTIPNLGLELQAAWLTPKQATRMRLFLHLRWKLVHSFFEVLALCLLNPSFLTLATSDLAPKVPSLAPVASPGPSGPLGPKSRASFWEQHAVQHKSASPRSSLKTISSMDIGRQRSTHFYDINVKCTMLIYVVWLRRGGLTKKARHQYHNISFVDMLYLIHFPVSSAVNPLTTRAWPCVLWQTPPGCD